MPPITRSLVVMLGALTAVFAVVVGVTAMTATGSETGAQDQSPISDRSPLTTDVSSQQSVSAAAGDDVSTLPAPLVATLDAATLAAAGTLVAQGEDLTVEAIALATPAETTIDGVTSQVDVVYRVTVTAGPYVMRAMPAVLAADGRTLGIAAESDDLQSLVLYTYDEAVVTSGVTISLSYGLPDTAPAVWSTTIEVAS